MHPKAIEELLEKIELLRREEKHEEALSSLEQVEGILPDSPALMLFRAQSHAALGRINEAIGNCSRLQRRLDNIRETAQALSGILDPAQEERLARTVTLLETEGAGLKATLATQMSEGLDKANLQATIQQLQDELQALTDEAGAAAMSEEAMAEQLSTLKFEELAKAEELTRAMHQLDEMQSRLVERDEAIQRAEQVGAEREMQLAALQQEVQSLQSKAEATAASERVLTAELARLKLEETDKAQQLDLARLSMENLQETLVEREQAIKEAEQRDADRAEDLARLERALTETQEQASSVSQSEQALLSELEQLRANERNTTEALDGARAELDSLRQTLAERESAIEAAEQRSQQSDAAMHALQGELDTIRKQANTAYESEKSLAAELAQLRADSESKTHALEENRTRMEALAQQLAAGQARMEDVEQRSSMSEEARKALEDELVNLHTQVNEYNESEDLLVRELQQLRGTESEKSGALNSAKSEVETLRQQIQAQEEAFKKASQTNEEHEAQLAALQQEMDALRNNAEQASSSEAKLTQELEQLRANEANKSGALDQARDEVEKLRAALEAQQTAMADAAEAGPQDEAALRRMQEELIDLHQRANEASESEKRLADEMQQLRRNEASKTGALKDARDQLTRLQVDLKDREAAAAIAAKERDERDGVIRELQQELAGLRERSESNNLSSEQLEAELARIESEGGVKAELLGEVHGEVDALRDTLAERDAALARSQYLLKRAKDRNRNPRGMYILFVILLLVSGAYVYWNESSRQETPEVEIRPELRFPTDYSLGSLYSRAATSRSDEDWVPEAEAQGTIYPNTDLVYHLKVDEERADELIALSRLDPRFIQSVWLPKFEMTDLNLDYIGSLKNLKDLYIDAHQPDADIARLQERLPDALITSKPPEVVVFIEETSPPLDRQLAFPTDRAIGRIRVRDWSLSGDDPWNDFTEARGIVRIKAGQEAKLVVDSENATNLTSLETIDPNALHSIEMSGNAITDASLANLRYLTGLQGLNLFYTKNVTDEGFKFLDDLRRLRSVDLYGVPITDEGFAAFDDCNRMQRLFLRSVPITVKSLAMLRKMTSLRTLHLEATGIPEEGLTTLKYDMPWCQISPMDQGV